MLVESDSRKHTRNNMNFPRSDSLSRESKWHTRTGESMFDIVTFNFDLSAMQVLSERHSVGLDFYEDRKIVCPTRCLVVAHLRSCDLDLCSLCDNDASASDFINGPRITREMVKLHINFDVLDLFVLEFSAPQARYKWGARRTGRRGTVCIMFGDHLQGLSHNDPAITDEATAVVM